MKPISLQVIIEKNIFKIKLKTNDYLEGLASTVENKLIYLSKYSFQSLDNFVRK